MAANQLVDNWRLAQANQEVLCGYACTVAIDGGSAIKAMLGDRTEDPIIVGAGISNKGGQEIQVALSDLPAATIEGLKNLTVVTSEGFTASWLFGKVKYGIVTATIGDPSGYRAPEHGFI